VLCAWAAALGLAAARPAAATVTFTGVTVADSEKTSVNFTTQGTTDWAHYGDDPGEPTNASHLAYDYKSGGGQSISNLSPIGPNGDSSYPGAGIDGTTVSFTDGTPGLYPSSVSDTNDPSFQYYNGYSGGTGQGVSFTLNVPTAENGVLNIYTVAYQANATLTGSGANVGDGDGSFSLSNSTVPIDDSGDHKEGVYTVDFTATGPDTLTFDFTNAGSDFASNTPYSNVGLYGATLSTSPISPAPEPSQFGMLGMLALGLGGLALRARRNRAA
jgi:hypothetical protein